MEIAIIGASGYTGGELMRLLLTHSTAIVTSATSRTLAGKPVDSVHTHLKGQIDLAFSNPAIDQIDADFAFLAVPHTVAMKYGGTLRDQGIRVVDLSADYRLPRDMFEKVYGVAHTNYFTVPYGLTELHRDEVRNATFVANPGCFPTGATLAAAPLAPYAKAIIFDSKTGVSGAGNTVTDTTHYPNVADNISPYKWTRHRHLSEMQMEISRLGSKAKCYFTPHLVPVNRGILTTAHILLAEPMNQKDAENLYRKFYQGMHFVRYQ
ncbi:MAG: N-acetyl-gamma-glutamyl-phosphate reductase, partial [Methanomicrobiales archaeon]|nr:N-acetyl-gamma-glutamyl-phosphate reductase [Methanomicrobiales archaeon]